MEIGNSGIRSFYNTVRFSVAYCTHCLLLTLMGRLIIGIKLKKLLVLNCGDTKEFLFIFSPIVIYAIPLIMKLSF